MKPANPRPNAASVNVAATIFFLDIYVTSKRVSTSVDVHV
jgi:hypothetical protein